MKNDKIIEIEYFRKIKKLHQAVERGTYQDEKAIKKILQSDPKRNMW